MGACRRICVEEVPESVTFSLRSLLLCTEGARGNEIIGVFSLSYVSMFVSELGSCRLVLVGYSLAFFGRQMLSVPKACLISRIIW